MGPSLAVPDPTRLTTPRQGDLRLEQLKNRAGFLISLLPNGAVFALEHEHDGRRVMVNQSLGSPVAGAMGGLYLRIGGREPVILPVAGARARCRVGVTGDRCTWKGETRGVGHEVTLRLHANQTLWLWHVEVSNQRQESLACDGILIQDLGLGEPGFLMNNEAYASQYLDHHVARHPRMGHVLMERQNLAQGGRHPWAAHGCLEGAVGFATDFRQVMGPAHRDADDFAIPFGTSLPSIRLQHEVACAALQSPAVATAPGEVTCWNFFGFYHPDHPAASADADLALIEGALGNDAARHSTASRAVSFSLPARSVIQDAPCAVADPLDEQALKERYPRQRHTERAGGGILSFFAPGEAYSSHIVLREKERQVLRRHGALLVSGSQLLPDEATLCVTCWMHGVFAAQLTIGNTSFHRLLSVSRDPYNITRGSGLRMLVDAGAGWRLLTVPSAFEMGMSECRWIYRLGGRTVIVSALVAADEPAVQWRVAVEGEACRFLAFGHLVLGEQEFAHAATWQLDASQRRFTFRPEPGGLWSQRYPQAVYHLVTSTPESVDAAAVPTRPCGLRQPKNSFLPWSAR
jgi:cellobiose phosphorylase